jgi:hypothetical protein
MAYEQEEQARRERLAALTEQIEQEKQSIAVRQSERNEEWRDSNFQREEARLMAELESLQAQRASMDEVPVPAPPGEVLVETGAAGAAPEVVVTEAEVAPAASGDPDPFIQAAAEAEAAVAKPTADQPAPRRGR